MWVFWLTWHTNAAEASYFVQTGGLVHTGAGHTLVDIQLATRPHVTPLALTLERTLGVYAFPSVLTWVRACSKHTCCKCTVAKSLSYATLLTPREGVRCSDAAALTQRAFVNVLIAGRSHVSWRAVAEVIPGNRVGVTVGAFLTGITDAGIIQLAQQS